MIIYMLFGLFAAVPLYFLWNFLAPIYFTFLPLTWQHIPYWHMALFCMIIGIIKSLLFDMGDQKR